MDPYSSRAENASLLRDHAEVLRRQIHPSMTKAGLPTSAAFNPTPKDGGYLSTLREVVDPEDACEFHLAKNLETLGTWGFSIGDVSAAELYAVDDGHLERNPANHASVVFTGLSRSQEKRAARTLKERALCLYLAPSH